MKKTEIQLVEEFHQAFEHPVLPLPVVPDKARWKFRIDFLREELNELEKACEENNIHEAADALCDLQYVLSGAVLEFGLKDTFGALVAEVHRSNMSKVCITEEEAIETVRVRSEEFKCECAYKEVSFSEPHETLRYRNYTYFVVYRVFDTKVLKSINYSAPDLKKIIESALDVKQNRF